MRQLETYQLELSHGSSELAECRVDAGGEVPTPDLQAKAIRATNSASLN
jgi:hypothetical protein